MRPVKNLAGQRFGRLTVGGIAGKDTRGKILWECRCDCGKMAVVRSEALVNGCTRSCGCLRTRDITGQRFGNLVALHPTGETQNTHSVWACQCDCGNIVYVRSCSLQSGNTQSCGCKINAPRITARNDITGRRFGSLVVLEATDIRERGFIVWKCKCDCGNTVTVRSDFLKNGKTESCGCLKRQPASKET